MKTSKHTAYLSFILVLSIVSFLLSSCDFKKHREQKEQSNLASLSPWQPGYLDIHHISTGSGDAAFMILPDGTTLLFDAGDLDKQEFDKKWSPLKASSPIPDNSMTAAQRIASYIKKMMPEGIKPKVDYGLISHFHQDHYGSLVRLAKQIPFGKIIDRDYPDYDFPLNLKEFLSKDSIFQDYLSFVKSGKIVVQALKVGDSSQIRLLRNPSKYPNFTVRNVKSNATIWTGEGTKTFQYFTPEDMISFYKGKYNENPLSLAIKISYGKFDYFTGGDNTGLQGFGLPKWFDVETPMAKAVGKVDVTTLNHHGNRDATNEYFVKTLNPKVVVEQSWCSDHPGQEVFNRLIYKDSTAESRDLFATHIFPETFVTYGPWFKKNYKSTKGHIVIRVFPKGNRYKVFILDEATLGVKKQYGFYNAH